MTRKSFDYSHGDTGTEPPNPLDFQKDGRPKAGHFDWLWYEVITAINGHGSEFDRLDGNDDGIVDKADYANDADATTYKGNDLDGDGDGVVDRADYANDADASTFHGNDLDTNSDGIVDEADFAHNAEASTYKGNDIDSNGDGTVDSADYANDADASTYKGWDIDSNGDGTVDAADYANDADASTFKGNDIDSDGDGRVNTADHALDADNASDADKVDGQHWSDIQTWVGNNYASDSHGNSDHSTNYLPEANYTPEVDTHDRYTDSEARSAVESGNLSKVAFTNGYDIVDSGGSYLQVENNGNRARIATSDVYVADTSFGWLSNIEDSSKNSVDADTVDGLDATELEQTTEEIQEPSLIHNDGFAPNFGG
jgi:hypothetical protein